MIRVEIYRRFGESCKFYFRYNSKPLAEAAGCSDVGDFPQTLLCHVQRYSNIHSQGRFCSDFDFHRVNLSRKITQNCRDPIRPIYAAMDRR